jgi:hypothetical protein
MLASPAISIVPISLSPRKAGGLSGVEGSPDRNRQTLFLPCIAGIRYSLGARTLIFETWIATPSP